MRLDHVQLAIPRGSEDICRRFYVECLGWREIPKPPQLAARGGLWLDIGEGEVHLGIDEAFRPARKAHPAFAVDALDTLAATMSAAGLEPRFDDAIPGVRRFYISDPVGNRLEFVETGPRAGTDP